MTTVNESPDSSMPQLPPDGNRLRTMNVLVDSAIVVFGRDGFRSARMEDVADHAGRSRTTLYTYFRGRNELVLAIRHRLSPATRRVFDRLDDLVDPTHAQVRAWIGELADVFERLRVECAISMEALSEPELHESLQEDLNANVARIVEAIGRARPDGRRPPRARIEIFFSQLLYTMHLTVIRRVFTDTDAVMDELAGAWLRELSG